MSRFNHVGFSLAVLMAAIGHTDYVSAQVQPLREAPIVETIVQSIDTQRLKSHVRAIEGDRSHVPTSGRMAARAYIADQFRSYGYEVTLEHVDGQPGADENVIARLEGSSDSNDLLVIGAHYDTVVGTPGADDNASGVAGLLEAARVLARTRPTVTIEFVAFDREEVDYRGSYQYVQNLVNRGENVIGMFDLEMIGFTCDDCQSPLADIAPGPATSPNSPCVDVTPETTNAGDFVLVVANRNSASLRGAFLSSGVRHNELQIVTAIAQGNGECFSDVRRSDHTNFWEGGFPALMITDTSFLRNNNYHMPTDTFATLDFDFMTDVVQATVATVAELAGIAQTQYRVLDDGPLLSDSYRIGEGRNEILERKLGPVAVPSTSFRSVSAVAVSPGPVVLDADTFGVDEAHLLAFRGVNGNTGKAAVYLSVLGMPDSWFPLTIEGSIPSTGPINFSPRGMDVFVDPSAIGIFGERVDNSGTQFSASKYRMGYFAMVVGQKIVGGTAPGGLPASDPHTQGIYVQPVAINGALDSTPRRPFDQMMIASFGQGTQIRRTRLSPDGNSAVFTLFAKSPSPSTPKADKGDIFVINDVLDIIDKGDANNDFIADARITSLNDPRIIPIRVTEPDKKINTIQGFFSSDSKLIAYSEDRNDAFNTQNLDSFRSAHFDMFLSNADGSPLSEAGDVIDSNGDLRLTGPLGEQFVAGIIPGSSQVLVLKTVGTKPAIRLFRQTIVAAKPVVGISVFERRTFVVDGQNVTTGDSAILLTAPMVVSDPFNIHSKLEVERNTIVNFKSSTRTADQTLSFSTPIVSKKGLLANFDGDGTLDTTGDKVFRILGGITVEPAGTTFNKPVKVKIAIDPTAPPVWDSSSLLHRDSKIVVVARRNNGTYTPISGKVSIDSSASPLLIFFEAQSIPEAATNPRGPGDTSASFIAIWTTR